MESKVIRRIVRRKLALQKLAAGEGVCKTAAAVGVTRATVGRWLRDPEFQAELDAILNQSLTEISQHRINAHKILSTATEQASYVLLELLSSESEVVRLQAARLILDKVTLPEPNPEAEKIEQGKLSFNEAYKKIIEDVYGLA